MSATNAKSSRGVFDTMFDTMIPFMVMERHATVNGRRSSYLEAGRGRPLVLLHAFPLSAAMWYSQLDHVPDGWRFIAPDLRGFGVEASPSADSWSPEGAASVKTPQAATLADKADKDVSEFFSMDDYARDVLALMDGLGIESAVIGGLSMGGYVTFALFRQAPERFDGVILADTKARPDSADARAARRAMMDLLRTKGVNAVVEALLPKLVGESSHRERPLVVADVRRLMEASSFEAIAAALHALMNRPDSTPDLGRIACPALVVVGQEDILTPAAEAEHLASSIRSAELVVLPRVGHLSNLEAPEGFSSALARFLSRAF